MSAPHNIVIVKGDTSTGQITLIPPGTVDVEDGDTVSWSIDANCKEVSSFRIKKKLLSQQIFSSLNHPPDNYGKTAEGLVSKRRDHVTLYTYSIKWKDNTDKKHEHDPIIAVKPYPFIGDSDSISKVIIGAAVAIAAFLSVRFLLRRKKEKARENEGLHHDF